MPTANEPQKAPGLDDRFCPGCGSLNVDLKTPAELVAESRGWFDDESDVSGRFIHDGKIAVACLDCKFSPPYPGDDGLPTLRDLLSGDSWVVDWVADFDIAKVARWAAIAVLERREFLAKGVNSQTGEEMLCLL